MRVAAVIALGLAGCALMLWLGPIAAEAALSRLGDEFAANGANVEALYTAIIFGGLLLLAIAGSAWSGHNPLDLGRNAGGFSVAGTGIGLAGIFIAVGIARLAGDLVHSGFPASEPGLLLGGTLLILFAAVVEEVYFRGWLQPVLAQSIGLSKAVLASALAFAALHVMGGARSPTTLVNLFLGGLLFGLLAARGGGIASAIGAHFAWNWVERIGLGLDPNPGLGGFGALVDLDLRGVGLWSGADEGLNGGLAMTVALSTLVVPLAILSRSWLVPGLASTGRRSGEGAW